MSDTEKIKKDEKRTSQNMTIKWNVLQSITYFNFVSLLIPIWSYNIYSVQARQLRDFIPHFVVHVRGLLYKIFTNKKQEKESYSETQMCNKHNGALSSKKLMAIWINNNLASVCKFTGASLMWPRIKKVGT